MYSVSGNRRPRKVAAGHIVDTYYDRGYGPSREWPMGKDQTGLSSPRPRRPPNGDACASHDASDRLDTSSSPSPMSSSPNSQTEVIGRRSTRVRRPETRSEIAERPLINNCRETLPPRSSSRTSSLFDRGKRNSEKLLLPGAPLSPTSEPKVVVKLISWMSTGLIRSMRFWDVCLPGSHNSGSWKLSDEHRKRWSGVVFAFLKLYIHCQEKTIFQQLQLGIRFLDLRVCKNIARAGEPYVAHGGFRTVSLREVYRQISVFLERHSTEVVVVSVRRDVAYLTGLGTINTLESDFLMAACLRKFLGPRLEADVTIGELADRGQNVIYFFEERERYLVRSARSFSDSERVASAPREARRRRRRRVRLDGRKDSAEALACKKVGDTNSPMQTSTLSRDSHVTGSVYAVITTAKANADRDSREGCLSKVQRFGSILAEDVVEAAAGNMTGDSCHVAPTNSHAPSMEEASSADGVEDARSLFGKREKVFRDHCSDALASEEEDEGYASDRSGITALPAVKAMEGLLSRNFHQKARASTKAGVDVHVSPSLTHQHGRRCPESRFHLEGRESGYSDPDLHRLYTKAVVGEPGSSGLIFNMQPNESEHSRLIDEEKNPEVHDGGVRRTQSWSARERRSTSSDEVTSDALRPLRRRGSLNLFDEPVAPVVREVRPCIGARMERRTKNHPPMGDSRHLRFPVSPPDDVGNPDVRDLKAKDRPKRRAHPSVKPLTDVHVPPDNLLGNFIKRLQLTGDTFEILTPFAIGPTRIIKSWQLTCDPNPRMLSQKLLRWCVSQNVAFPRDPFVLRVMAGEVTPPSFDSPESSMDVVRFWTVQGATALVSRNRGLRSAAADTHKLLLRSVINSRTASRVNGITHDFVSELVISRIVKLNIMAALAFRAKEEVEVQG